MYPSSPSKSKQPSNHTVLSRALSKLSLHAQSGPRLGPGFRRRRRQVAREEPASPRDRPRSCGRLYLDTTGSGQLGEGGSQSSDSGCNRAVRARGQNGSPQGWRRGQWEQSWKGERQAAGTQEEVGVGGLAGERGCADRLLGCRVVKGDAGRRAGTPGSGRGTRRGGNWGARR